MASVAAINNIGAHAHNPRGNLWFNDDSSYGHKMLMKMGWSKGKGLGKNEDGIKENLKVKFKDSKSGLGFKDDACNNVMKTEYESILKSLNAEYSSQRKPSVGTEVNVQENKGFGQNSRVVKGKIRYSRLYYGKDVSQYSEKDMKSIFICSQPFKDKKQVNLDESITSHSKESASEHPKTIETYHSNLSVSDYFAMKMKEKKSNISSGSKESCNGVDNQIASPDSESPKSEMLTSEKINPSRKKRKLVETDISEHNVHDEDLKQAALKSEDKEAENMNDVPNKKSKKRRKNSEESFSETGENSLQKDENENNSKSPNNEFCNDKTKTSEICETSLVSNKKKKKKKNKSKETYPYNAINHSLENPVTINNKMVENLEVVSEPSQESLEEKLLNNNVDCSKKKKKLKKKIKEKLKSCLKSKNGSYSLKNVSFNERVSYRVIDTDFESVEYLSDNQSLVNNITYDESSSEDSDLDKNSISDNTSSVEEVHSNEPNVNGDSSTAEESSDEGCSLHGLPSPKSPHYNCWVESQRQALKMELYKNMLKNMKNHDVFRTTNLLSIKGYGNWGFK